MRAAEGGGEGQQAAEGGAGRLGGHQGQHRGPGGHVQTTGRQRAFQDYCVILSLMQGDPSVQRLYFVDFDLGVPHASERVSFLAWLASILPGLGKIH